MLAPVPEGPAPGLQRAAASGGTSDAADAADEDEHPGAAAAWLKRGFDLLRADQNVAAAHAFRAAIGTGNLNDAGRALGYWHVYLAEQGAGHSDPASDALASFIVVAEDILHVRRALRYAEDGDSDFVDRFDLKRRLARARAVLSATWATHASAFGRSRAHPVPVHNPAERDYFLEVASPCAQVGAPPRSGQPSLLSDTEQVELSCVGVAPTRYFFERVAED